MSRFRLGICFTLFALFVLFLFPKSATAANLCSLQIDSNGNKTYDCKNYCSSTFTGTTTGSDFCNTPAYLNPDCSTYLILPGSNANMTPAQCCKNVLENSTALCSAPRNNPPCNSSTCGVSYPMCGTYTCSDPLLTQSYLPLVCSFGVSFTCYLPPPPIPCDQTPVCNVIGTTCTALANTCSASNGTRMDTNCKYTTYNGSTNCAQVAAPNQLEPCTTDNCDPGKICIGGICKNPSPCTIYNSQCLDGNPCTTET